MTLTEVVRGRSTLEQFKLYMWADRNLRTGRHFGGQLSESQLALLLHQIGL